MESAIPVERYREKESEREREKRGQGLAQNHTRKGVIKGRGEEDVKR